MIGASNNPQAIDKRRRLLLDEIRAKFWIEQVKKISGFKTSYSLDKEFGGGQKKWASYMAGRMPNEETIAQVENKFRGTADLLVRGPNNLALWPSLDPRTPIEMLDIISRHSKGIDGDIARFRLESTAGNLFVVREDLVRFVDATATIFHAGGSDSGDDFLKIGCGLYIELHLLSIVSTDVLDLIGMHLYQLIKPYRDLACQLTKQDELCVIDGYRQSMEDSKRYIEEEAYINAAIETIGSKGSRGRRQ